MTRAEPKVRKGTQSERPIVVPNRVLEVDLEMRVCDKWLEGCRVRRGPQATPELSERL